MALVAGDRVFIVLRKEYGAPIDRYWPSTQVFSSQALADAWIVANGGSQTFIVVQGSVES